MQSSYVHRASGAYTAGLSRRMRATTLNTSHTRRLLSHNHPLRSAAPLSESTCVSAASPSSPTFKAAAEQVYHGVNIKRDPFLREGTVTSRFFRAYRKELSFPLRMLGIFFLGFSVGMVLEVFACKTHLYESVMMKKDARRHEFDEFVIDFRQNVERWQREDMGQQQAS